MPRSPQDSEQQGIPGYEILEVARVCGVVHVYRARQTRLNRVVALHLFPARFDGLVERVRKEAEIHARLHHPHVVTLLDYLEHQGQPVLITEWTDGGTLFTRSAREPQPLRPAAELVESLARTLSHVHAAGVIHRDLKPSNIALQAPSPARPGVPQDELRCEEHYGTPMLMGFELAIELDAIDRLRQGESAGTPLYMAPEQIEARHADLGPPTDIYALGMILYELLTGRPPFDGRCVQELFQRALETEPTPPRRLRPGLDRRTEAICLKCLRKDHRQRYATGEELAADLREVLEKRGRRSWLWRRLSPLRLRAPG